MLRLPLLVLLLICSCLVATATSLCLTPQVSCPASSTLAEVPTAWYAVTFDTDPSLVVGQTAYNWSAVDPTESCPYAHSGVVSFDGEGFSDGLSGQSYVDLNAVSGPNSAGLSAPLSQSTIGGYGGSGDVAAGTSGWSFEVTGRAEGNTVWAKLYCLGAGEGYHDILTGFVETTLEIDHSLDYAQSAGVAANRVVFPRQPGVPLHAWQHIIAVYQAVDPTETAASGRLFIYVNGQLQQTYADFSQRTYEPVVPAVYRYQSYLGRSCYAADGLFNGSIDTFRIYERALTGEQADALYHQQMGGCNVTTTSTPLVRDVTPNQLPNTPATTAATPFFSLTAASDPRPAAGLSSTTALYGWRETDFVDTQCTQYSNLSAYHSGLLVLPGGANVAIDQPTLPYVNRNFINLSASTGPNSIGRVLPVVGGPSAGNFDDGTAGWSFEFTVKPGMQEEWAKVMDLGSTRNQSDPLQCNNDITFGYYVDSNALSTLVCDAYGSQTDNIQFTPFTPGQWVHGVVVFQAQSYNSNLSNWQLFQSGRLVNSVSGLHYPQAVVRHNANLGLSNWPDPQFAGLLDTFNVYDVALSQAQVAALYKAATGGIDYCPTSPVDYIPPDATFFAADFNTDPAMSSHPTFQWLPFDPTDSAADQFSHRGLLILNGSSPVSQYVDLALSTGDAAVTSQPIQPIGGLGTGGVVDSSLGWSFELVFKSFARTTWGKAFDFSNHDGDSGALGGSWDVNFGWYEDQQTYVVNEYFNVSYQDPIEYVTADPFPLDTWTHFIWTVGYDAYTSINNYNNYPSAIFQTYIDGQQTSFSYYNHYLDRVVRQHAYLGRSSYNDSAWQGAIDSFRVYSVALNAQQVTTLYEASLSGQSGGGGSESSSSSTGSSVPSAPSSSSSSSTPSSVLGDPQFVGLLGQSYQVHGIDGEVYSLLRDSTGVRVNARFVFLAAGRCPPTSAIETACWSHPGSYLGEVGVVSAEGAKMSVASGPAAWGCKSVTLDGKPISIGAIVTVGSLSFHYASSHALTLSVGNYALALHNSDTFINIASFAVHERSELSARRCHGLLGQTWRTPGQRGSDVAQVEGSVDDYAEGGSELFGESFARFDSEQA